MLKRILRVVIMIILVALLSAAIVFILGLILKWKTSIEFSNAFFWAGVIVFVIGAVNFIGMNNQDDYSNRKYKLVNNLDKDAGFKLWMADITHGKSFLVYMGIVALILWGFSALAITFGT